MRDIRTERRVAAFMLGRQAAVDPDAMHADRVGGEAGRAGGQVVDAPLRAAADGLRVEQQQVGGVTGTDEAAILEAEHARRVGRDG